MNGTWWRYAAAVIALQVAVFLAMYQASGAHVYANPSDPAPAPLPAVAISESSWVPKFPFPFDQYRDKVTQADIVAEGEMCQWFNGQYLELRRQLDRFGFDLLHANNDWTVEGIQLHADAVAANVEQVVAFLTPRAESLTQSQDFAGDMYFPIYQGESFYRLWQHLANTEIGIRARNTAWIYGPSQQRVKHWASRIERSHVCD